MSSLKGDDQLMKTREQILEDLKLRLSQLSAGTIQGWAIEDALASCWHELKGNEEGGMVAYKLRKGRMEDVVWNPPLLAFAIERHGAVVNGSVYAEVQHWSVNVDTRTATLGETERRLLGMKDKPLKVEPLVDGLIKSIVEHASDSRLKWDGDSKVKALIAEIIPATNRETTTARRKRFWKALEAKIHAHGWQRLAPRSQFLVRL
jgi:hypothetical protein